MENKSYVCERNIINKVLVNTKVHFKKLIATLIIITTISALTGALLVGCSGKSVEDMSGNSFVVDKEVNNIACLWPSYTSSLITLGLGDKISAVSTNTDEFLNAWAKKIYPSCANYTNFKTNMPSVDQLKEGNYDAVILHPDTISSGYQKELIDAGIKAFDLRYSSYDEMAKSLNIVGSLLDQNSADKIKQYNELVQSKMPFSEELHNSEDYNNPRVTAYLHGHDMDVQGVYPENSVVSDWVDYNTSVYIMKSFNLGDSTSVPIANLRLANVIFIGGPYKNYVNEELTTSDIWASCHAVQSKEIYMSPTGVASWGDIGVESVLMMDYALIKSQPDTAQKYNITIDNVKQQAKEFYRDFSNVSLSDAEVDYMLNNLGPDGQSIDHPIQL